MTEQKIYNIIKSAYPDFKYINGEPILKGHKIDLKLLSRMSEFIKDFDLLNTINNLLTIEDSDKDGLIYPRIVNKVFDNLTYRETVNGLYVIFIKDHIKLNYFERLTNIKYTLDIENDALNNLKNQSNNLILIKNINDTYIFTNNSIPASSFLLVPEIFHKYLGPKFNLWIPTRDMLIISKSIDSLITNLVFDAYVNGVEPITEMRFNIDNKRITGDEEVL